MNRRDDQRDGASRLDGDALDDLLREWHGETTQRALRAEATRPRVTHAAAAAPRVTPAHPSWRGRLWSFAGHPGVRAAATIVVLALLATVLIPRSGTQAMAETILVPNGGRLEARDDERNLIGPCALAHTDVDIAVSGPFARVTVRQKYHNPYETKIEAVYTFPLSHHGAVDRMTMTVGDRVVVGEVHERDAARRIYQAARAQGYVASLLEQERPNIFTQSVANIEPGADIAIEISYVELVPMVEGEYRLHFPMTVAPRYIPGYPVRRDAQALPAGQVPRHGVNLLGPARVVELENAPVDPGAPGAPAAGVAITDETLIPLLRGARPIRFERSRPDAPGPIGRLRFVFEVEYGDGARERGRIFESGVGELNGRWFVIGPAPDPAGPGFSPNTTQVPDASRITPMPAPPETRAGHDVSVDVTIDTGGPAITGYRSELHRLRERGAADAAAPANVVQLALENETEIPNRDFLLRWTVDESRIQEAIFVHRPAATETDPDPHGYFTMMLRPPARVDDAVVRPRELVFVLDSSGSMKGFPIEKAQAVMQRAIDAMRPQDVFNVITFNEQTDVLWATPRPATVENRAIAVERILARQGGGGTEMMPAVVAALTSRGPGAPGAITPDDLANLPADGRTVEIRCPRGSIESGDGPDAQLRVRDDLRLALKLPAAPVRVPGMPSTADVVLHPPGPMVRLRGTWMIRDGERTLDVQAYEGDDAVRPLRCVFFLSDGEVGNDRAVVDAVREHASGARVFTVGIGSSPNRSLLDAMAKAGRGASDYISLEGDADAAVETFVRRIGTPVLTDIQLAFDGVEITDVLPPPGTVVDLYDERPLIVQGRYTTPGHGTLAIRGVTGAGAYERKLDLDLPARAPAHDVIATHWARAKVDERLKQNDRAAVIALGEKHQLLTPYTSFVAVERSRITVGGEPMLVTVPIEMPEGQSWEGTFGECRRAQLAALDAADDEMLRRTSRLASRLIKARNGISDVERAVTLESGAYEAQFQLADFFDENGELRRDRLASLGRTVDAQEGELLAYPWMRGAADERAVGQVPDSFAMFGQPTAGSEALFIEGTGWSNVDMYFATTSATAVGGTLAVHDKPAPTLGVPMLVETSAGVQLREAERLGQISGNVAFNLDRSATSLEEKQVWRAAAYALPDADGSPAIPELWQLGEAFAAKPGQAESGEIEVARREHEISERLERARKLNAAFRERDALEVIDEVLFLDETNREAFALREAIQPTPRFRFKAVGTDDIQRNLMMEALGAVTIDQVIDGTLAAVLEDLAQRLSIVVHVDWSALEAVGVTADEPVTVAGATSAGAAIERLLAQIGDGSSKPRCFIVPDGLLITTEAALQERAALARAKELTRLLAITAPQPGAFDDVDVMLVLLGRVAADGADEDAHAMAEAIIMTYPNDDRVLGLSMTSVETWDERTRDRIAAIADAARTRIATQLAAWEEQVVLRRVLHESLLPIVTDEVAKTPPNVDVSVLVTDTEPGTLRAIERIGLDVQGRSESRPMVVGTIASSKLRDLALLDVVRRVEPLATYTP